MTARLQKEIGLTIMCITLSGLLFFGLAYTLADVPQNTPLFIALVPLAVAWLVITAITLYLLPRWGFAGAICLAAAVGTLSAGGLNNWGAIGGGLLIGLLTAGAAQAFKRDSRNLRQYRTVSIFAAGSRLLLTGLILAGAGIALPVIEGSIKREGLAVTPKQVAFVLRPLAPLLKDIVPNFTLTSNVDGQESLADIVTGRLNQTLQRVTQVNALTVALVAVVLAFLTIRALIPLVAWVLLAAVALGMWFARGVGLVVTLKETIDVENLTL